MTTLSAWYLVEKFHCVSTNKCASFGLKFHTVWSGLKHIVLFLEPKHEIIYITPPSNNYSNYWVSFLAEFKYFRSRESRYHKYLFNKNSVSDFGSEMFCFIFRRETAVSLLHFNEIHKNKKAQKAFFMAFTITHYARGDTFLFFVSQIKISLFWVLRKLSYLRWTTDRMAEGTND